MSAPLYLSGLLELSLIASKTLSSLSLESRPTTVAKENPILKSLLTKIPKSPPTVSITTGPNLYKSLQKPPYTPWASLSKMAA